MRTTSVAVPKLRKPSSAECFYARERLMMFLSGKVWSRTIFRWGQKARRALMSGLPWRHTNSRSISGSMFDVSVLVACDGDFLPLVRKLNTLGTRVMLTAWDFEWMDRNQQQRTTRTDQVLLDEVSYPIMMHQVIDDRSRRNDPLVKGLFIPQKELRAVVAAATVAAPSLSSAAPSTAGAASADVYSGTIQKDD